MGEISFGEWVKRRRQANGLTQKQLAPQISCAVVTLRKIEADERRPSAQIVERLADIFAIPAAERPKLFRFSRGDWTQPSPEIQDAPPWQPAPRPRSNLPAGVTVLIGRKAETRRVQGYLQDPAIRLVTLTGPPGIGKTSLALEAAREVLPGFSAGAFFVALAPLDDSALVPSTIAQAIGLVEVKAQAGGQQLLEGINDKPMLVVLDNCEHLIEGVAPLVSDLLSACPRLKILATSRESLRIAGEWVVRVPALKTPGDHLPATLEEAAQFPALTLFVERARAAHSDFTLTVENLDAVAAICAQLEGLPLAIELIAARMRLFSPRVLLERLTASFVLTADGMRAAAARQKTLGNAIAWSYNALPAEEQTVFACLAVFSGGFTLVAAESICLPGAANRSIAELISSLLDKSLLQHALGGADSWGGPRFHMFMTLQEFALKQLRRIDGEAGVRNFHLAYFLHLAEEGDLAMRGPRQVEWIERIENEHDNFRAALEWGLMKGKSEAVLRMLCALGWPWEVRGHYSEALGWLERIQAMPDVEEHPVVYARLLNHIGRYCWTQEKVREGQALLEKAQAIVLRAGPVGERTLAETWNWLGLSFLDVNGENERAKSLVERGFALYQKWSDAQGVALSIFHLGIIERERGRLDLARSLLEQSLALFRQSGDLFFVARVSNNLGYLYLNQGAYAEAESYFEQHLAIDQGLQFWSGIADGWLSLGNLRRLKGEYRQAGECFEKCVLVCQDHGLMVKDPYYQSGLMALHLMDFKLAWRRFTFLLHQAQELGEKEPVGIYLSGLAAAAAESRQAERAATLFGAAQKALEAFHPRISAQNQAVFERYLRGVRDQIGEAVFEALAASGRALTSEDALQSLQNEVLAAMDEDLVRRRIEHGPPD